MDIHYAQLYSGIENEDLDALKFLLSNGVNPNSTNDRGEPILSEAADSWRTSANRFTMTRLLLEAGASTKAPKGDIPSPLFAAVLSKDADVIQLMLEYGADPNEDCDCEPIYSWAEFDYRHDEYDSGLPENPNEDDKASEDSWLKFLQRMALKHQKRPPDYLIVLRNAGAKTWNEANTSRTRRCSQPLAALRFRRSKALPPTNINPYLERPFGVAELDVRLHDAASGG